MSYILDALRRADAERQRGTVPGLHDQPAQLQPAAAGPTRQPAAARGLWWGGGGRRPFAPEPPPMPYLQLAALLAALATVGPFSIDTMFPAFPQIGEQFAVDKVAMQQTISAYLFAYALMSLVHGPLSDAVGRKRVILGGLTSVPGAIIGGLVIGVGEKLSEVYIGPYFGGGIEIWFAYVLALGFLLVRPQGLFGEKIIDRV